MFNYYGETNQPFLSSGELVLSLQATSRQIRSLQFSNPGKFMEDFDPEHSQREMRKVQRRLYNDTLAAASYLMFMFSIIIAQLCLSACWDLNKLWERM
jgi:hypothetical protein